ncbi:MAG: hypothetical protein RR547_01825 [Raoultibacter sp.]
MNLNDNVTLKSKKTGYPTKTTINLISANAMRKNTGSNIVLFLVFIVLLAIFAKFAVIDPLSASMQSSAELDAAKAKLAALEVENQSYSELSDQYMHYVVTGLTEGELNRADRNELIDLLRTKVLGATYISSVKVVGNSVTIACVGANLQEVSTLVQNLEQDSRVAYVTVSTAMEREDTASTATIQIELKGASSKTEGGDNV